MPALHEISLGCCGWSYDDWKGVFYPAGARPGEYLQYYAEKFDIVEVDSTFYRTPSKRMVVNWRDRTPPDFRFALKLPRSITHDKVLVDCDREMEAFYLAVKPLGEKLHSVCLQFGYFNKKAFSSLDPFLERLHRFLEAWPPDVPKAVEIRNRQWLGNRWSQFLKSHHAALVLVQQSWMPSPQHAMLEFDVLTGPFGYIRLLGDRKKIEEVTKTWEKVVLDKSEELRETAEAIRAMAENVPVAVFANNHFAGHAPATLAELRKFLTTD